MLSDIEAMAPGVKLGFQAHYPQLETKLALRGTTTAELDATLAPLEAEVRKRLGNFIVAEDTASLESVVLDALRGRGGSLAVAESFTGGGIAARLLNVAGAEGLFRRGVVSRDAAQLAASVGVNGADFSPALAEQVARALRDQSGASHAVAVLVTLDEGADGMQIGGDINIGLADAEGAVVRQARLLGGRDWVRLGAVEMGLDSLRRRLLGLPVDERLDFERR
jgi:nicotinamide-nucleotide amidase